MSVSRVPILAGFLVKSPNFSWLKQKEKGFIFLGVKVSGLYVCPGLKKSRDTVSG